ncbi:TolC family protein [uncultured Dokdonia sp.]|uniref:TolC family protein n=1 Tax=uncultured Dokdonia sp. TaxID=575653 RepID=UPI0030EDBFD5|tara:strand:+ start:63833 stop:65236 length:1404 start_codon:yes stop_codon:yes gene_type:complete
MRLLIKYTVLVLCYAFAKAGLAQTPVLSPQTISFEEYLGYVKQHHPLIKQAELVLSTGEANLLKARGGFDPKIEVDYDRKKFKDTEYFDQLNATFKIPTWYGIELKGSFEENTGEFLNPNLTVPEDGLYSAGVSFALAQGLLINERMATLKKARFFEQQTIADRDLLVNNLIYEASLAYFNWVETENEKVIYDTFLKNATTRLDAVTRSVAEGDKAAIDITEARITAQTRRLNLEAASLNAQKARLVASNFLWIDGIPLEIQETVYPENPELSVLDASLLLTGITDTSVFLNNHPKLKSLDAKIDGLEVDRFLKKNKLLPKVNLQYNFLSPDADRLDGFNTANYKAFVDVSFPIFLRKERGDLNLAKLKVQDAEFERTATSLAIKNKLDATEAEITSLLEQNNLITEIVVDYEALVKAEERKFFLGESSLFLINSREQKLIDARLKANALSVKELTAKAKLYNAAGL